MIHKFTFLFFACLVFSSLLKAQTAGDFRSVGSGNWSNINIWEEFDGFMWDFPFSVPTSSSGQINIRSGHTVTVSSAVTADQIVVDAGGTLTVSGAALTIANGTGDDLTVNGTLNVSNAINLTGTIVNNGTINWSAGNFSFTGGTLTNNATFNITGNNNLSNTSGTNLLSNSSTGTITKSTGVGTTNIPIPLTNAGTINVNSGTFRPGGGAITNSGTINLANNSIFSNNFGLIALNSGTSITGSGSFRTANTTINLALTIPSGVTFESFGEIFASLGSLAVNGIFEWTASPVRIPVTIASGATLNISGNNNKIINGNFINNGTTNWSDGNLLFNTATFTNNSIFNANFAADHTASRGAGSADGIINSSGATINKTGASTTLTVTTVPVTNAGTIQGVGTMNFSNFTNNGTIAPGNSAGVLTINPSAVSSASTTSIEILASGGPGVGHDELILTGNTNLAGSTLQIIDNVAAPDGVYTIMTTSSGTFSNTFGTVNKPSNYMDPVISGNTITIEKFDILPVVWGNISVKAVSNGAELSWSTLQESNTSHFVVEYSTNGRDFTSLTSVSAKGNSNSVSYYSYVHSSPISSGTNFYRLRQLDLDGRGTLSEIFPLSFKDNSVNPVSITSNPLVGNMLQLSVKSENITIILTDLSGRVHRNMRLQQGSYSLPVNELKAGVYQLTIFKNKERIETLRILKP